jgi:hypothetical protein
VQALSSRAEYADSNLSNSLNVITSFKSVNALALDQLTGSRGVTHSNENYKNDEQQLNVNTRDAQILLLIKHYEQENENEYDESETTIPIKVSKLAEDYFDLDWSSYIKHHNYDEFKIYWHCLNTNEYCEHRCAANVFNYRIKKLKYNQELEIKNFQIFFF